MFAVWVISNFVLLSASHPLPLERQQTPPQPHQNENGKAIITPAKNSWPEGDYCIMPGTQAGCPTGFIEGSIQLAVPMEVGLGDMYFDGSHNTRYIQWGRIGGMDLSVREYDRLYTLKLSACCRSMAEPHD